MIHFMSFFPSCACTISLVISMRGNKLGMEVLVMKPASEVWGRGAQLSQALLTAASS